MPHQDYWPEFDAQYQSLLRRLHLAEEELKAAQKEERRMMNELRRRIGLHWKSQDARPTALELAAGGEE